MKSSHPRTVILFRHNVGGRKRLLASGRFLVGYSCDKQAPDDEQKLTLLNFDSSTMTLIFAIKPHDIGTLIEDLLTVVVNHNILPIPEVLGNIVRPMPYDAIAKMVNQLDDVNARKYIKERINTDG